MSESHRPPVSGLVAGKYEVVRLIGRGGMGSVWEGRHASIGTRFAIKFIDKEYAESEDARSRFVNEARAAATIQSKHAIQIFDHGVTDEGRPYLVMELLTGEPLDKRLERLGRIPLPETARILGQVCRALQRAHDAGIIHRDLKPENIFLVRSLDDDDESAKVLDFGIAKIKGPPGQLTSSTKTGAVLGTPYYMSPEQARGLRNLDYRSDLWSLGIIAYKCVTGVLPFDGESVGDLLVKICTAPPPTPSMTVPGLPATFDAWFFRALEREPKDRFGSAAELSDALGLAAGLSMRRGPSSSARSGKSGTVASPPAASPHPIAPTVLAGGAAPAATPPLPAAGITSAPITSPALPTKSTRGLMLVAIVAALVGGLIGIAAVIRFASVKRAEVHVANPATASAAMVTSASANRGADTAAATGSSATANLTGNSTSTSTSTSTLTPIATPTSTSITAAAAGTRSPVKPQKALATASPVAPKPSKPSPTSADPGY
jgi:serine/threonine-protein kinase